MQLSDVVPWGRSLAEYRAMFALSDMDLKKKILGCADGPASFNAELTGKGGNVVSVDPLYGFDADQIEARIAEVCPIVMAETRKRVSDYVWKNIADPEALERVRMDAMNSFLTDYRVAGKSGRYLDVSLPQLPFADNHFELALCSHFLFLYSDHIDCIQHILSMRELCRVAGEVRVFPLLTIQENRESPHLQPVMDDLREKGMHVSLLSVNYEFQKGANTMLVVKKS